MLACPSNLRLVIGLKFTIQLGVDITTAAIMIDTNSQVPTITIDTNTPNLATAAIQINTNSKRIIKYKNFSYDPSTRKLINQSTFLRFTEKEDQIFTCLGFGD